MDPAVIGRTQETLGKVIRKPPLTEKLLGKPPFRYLHDILSEVIRTTGFFKGLYKDSELKSDNVKEKDAKIIFLQKAIDVITLVTGEPLTVKPARIVAGHEPEKTNELLQAIGKCCLEKLSSEEAVRRVLAGEKPDSRGKSTSKSQDKVSREAKEEDRKRTRQDKRESENREGSGSRERREKHHVKEEEKKNVEQEREQRKESEKNRVGDEERNGLREGEKNDKEKNRARDSRLETERDKIKEKARDRKSDGSRRKEKDKIQEKGLDREHEKERSKERDPERDKRKERTREDEAQKEREEEKIRKQERTMRKSKGSDNSPKRALEDPAKENKSVTDKERLSNAIKSERPSASKLRERRPARLNMEGESGSEEERESSELPATDFKDNLDAQSPNFTQRPIPRPGSARPAPPRVRRQASADVPVPERVSSGKGVANVIVDKEKEDDDEFVVEEAPLQLPDMPEMELGQRVELQEDEKHGALVNKILETKKDYETQADTENKEKLLLSDAGKKKEKDMVTREIEKLRSSIQTLCRSALPLGKIMDYLQEDVDTMQNELQIWRRENNQHAKALLQEQSVTETAVEPLKAELAELEQLIKEQQDKICSMKSNILRNEEKIQKMVLRINA